MDKPKTTPKDFFLWAGAMVSLWAGIIAFITLLFTYINHAFPNPVAYYFADPWQSVSYQMASLIVLAPVFLILMRVIRRGIERDPSRNDIWVRRWALYLTVFAAGATIVIDLITLIMVYLRGEDLTVAFLLKVLVVFLVAGAGFLHFLADLNGYWRTNPSYARYVNWATGVVVLVAIVAGFFIVGTPQQARQYRLDEQRVSDLQNIQWQIVNYWQRKESLPATLSDLNDEIGGYSVPVDPATGTEYRYTRQSPLDFTLCATFGASSRGAGGVSGITGPEPVFPSRTAKTDSWQHGVGEVCFDRSIDPELYPPYSK